MRAVVPHHGPHRASAPQLTGGRDPKRRDERAASWVLQTPQNSEGDGVGGRQALSWMLGHKSPAAGLRGPEASRAVLEGLQSRLGPLSLTTVH